MDFGFSHYAYFFSLLLTFCLQLREDVLGEFLNADEAAGVKVCHDALWVELIFKHLSPLVKVVRSR